MAQTRHRRKRAIGQIHQQCEAHASTDIQTSGQSEENRNMASSSIPSVSCVTHSYNRDVTLMIIGAFAVILLGACTLPACSAQAAGVVPQYFVDVFVVTDAPIFQAWYGRAQASAGVSRRQAALQAIRVYVALVIQEVDKRYQTLRRYDNFRLNVRLVGMFIAETAEQSPWTAGAREGGPRQVDAGAALRSLSRWVRASPGLAQHDHTMLLTGYDLVTDDAGVLFPYTIGRATVRTVCQGAGRSVSVLEDRGAFQSVHTAAHELSHSLGAVHDGTGNTCSAADRFIMAGGTEPRTPENLRNPWIFSPCSNQEITAYLNTLISVRPGAQCLMTALPQIGVPDVRGIMPGQLYNANQQCQHIFGPQSRFCHGGNFGPLSQICTSMFCLRPDNNSQQRKFFCVEYHAAHGTTCGNGQWCEEGACIASPNAPNLPPGDCPFGDQLTLVNDQRCPVAIGRRPALCYTARVRRICCATCAQAAQANENANRRVCQWGDRAAQCNQRFCSTLLPDGSPYAQQCCGTCSFDASQWACADRTGSGSASCASLVCAGGVQGCYNSTLAFECCSTCGALRNSQAPSGCEYGDLLPEFCRRVAASGQPCTTQRRQQCCSTCKALDGNNDNNDNGGKNDSNNSNGTLTGNCTDIVKGRNSACHTRTFSSLALLISPLITLLVVSL